MRNEILEEINSELNKANESHPNFHSHHEAYAVILEEVCEYWDEVRKRKPNVLNMRKELIQVAAMCVKTIESFNMKNTL
jgi:NTP pyrophosphatase (non-canonical NTP hydrolase)